MAKCKFCGKEIFWMKEGRKNKPYEEDGTPHSCEEMKSARNSLRTIQPGSLSPEEIAKYEQAMNESASKKKKK